mmetsp:Transcript_5120/g.15314  ORF Transcript_5120/g.15314 Transcript_5120/m.15314 type:complete len:427 (+) Transcript_5120:89-1369(+)
MALLRHGEPLLQKGWLLKEGKLSKMKHRRYGYLENTTFTTAKEIGLEPTFTADLTKCRVGAGKKKCEIVIVTPDGRQSFFGESAEDTEQWIHALTNNAERTFDKYYTLGKPLGNGATAEVFSCNSKDNTEIMAAKVVDKGKLNDEEMSMINKELLILRLLNHENVVTTYDIFESIQNVHIVMRQYPGEAFDIISEIGHMNEMNASVFMRELLQGVAYLHRIGIAHRDLKPENILCCRRTFPLNIVIADFGISEFMDSDKVCAFKDSNHGGTPGYIAPEVILKQKHGCAVDMWACGVLMYIVLSGKMPFFGRSDEAIMLSTTNGEYKFPEAEWKTVSGGAKSLIRSMLQVDPRRRISAEDALKHPWVAYAEKNPTIPIGNDLCQLNSALRWRHIGGNKSSLRKLKTLGSPSSKRMVASMSFTGAIPS